MTSLDPSARLATGSQRGLDAEGPGGVDDAFRAEVETEPRHRHVQRVLEGGAQVDASAEAPVVVRRLPVTLRRLDAQRFVLEQRREGVARGAAFTAGEAGEGHDGLEDASWLALGLGGPVELAPLPVPAADVGADGSALGIEGDERGLQGVVGAAELLVLGLETFESFADGSLGGALPFGVETGSDPSRGSLGPDLGLQVALELREEVGRVDSFGW